MLSVAQGLTYVGLFLAAGVVLCRTWVLRGVRIGEVAEDRLTKVTWAGLGLLVVAGGFAIPVSGAYQQGLGLTGLGEQDAVALSLVGDDLLVLGLQVVGLLVALFVASRLLRWLGGAIAPDTDLPRPMPNFEAQPRPAPTP